MKSIFLGIFLLVVSNSLGQTIYLTISGGSLGSEKWTNITTGANGTGTQVWGQGNGTYGNGAGYLTNNAIDITAYCGTTLYFNTYDKYADSWDGTTYKLMLSANGTVIINNSNNTPNGNGNSDASSAWDNPPPSLVELESSESFTVACACVAPTSVTLSGFSTPICSGYAPGTFTATAVGGSPTVYSYLWFKDGVSTGVTTQTYSPGNLTTNTNIYCAVSTGAGCATNSATQTITVNTVPTGVTAVATPNPVCPGATLTLIGSATGATGWNWTHQSSGFTSSAQSPTVLNFAVIDEGIYTLVASNACGSAGSVNTAAVTLSNTSPTGVVAVASPSPLCVGGTLLLSGSGTDATNWSWTGPNGFTSSLQNPTISGITSAGAGIYTLVASNCIGSSSAVNTSTVVVQTSVPTGAIANAAPNPVFIGNSLTLTGSATNATSWSWTGPNGFSSSSQNPTITSVTSSNAGVYTLVASNSCGSAASVNTASVTVNRTWYVDDNSNTSDVYTLGSASGNDGANGAKLTPFASLSKALSVAQSGDSILIDAGTYTGNNNRDLTLTVSNLKIVGAGMNVTTFDNAGGFYHFFMRINQNNTMLANMTLKDFNDQGAGNGQSLGINANITGVNINNVMVFSGSTSSNLSGYPIEVATGASVNFNGGGSACNDWDAGGGIRVSGATTVVNISNYLFANNLNMWQNGCALKVTDGTVVVQNSRFQKNQSRADKRGAGIHQSGGTLTVKDCVFDQNQTWLANDQVGGTILITGGNCSLKRSVISNHTQMGGSTSYGAGIGVMGGTVYIDSCKLFNNSGDLAYGTDVYVSGGTVFIRNSTLSSTNNRLGATGGSTTVSNSGSFTTSYSSGISFVNTTSPSYTANPTVPNFSGTCPTSITILPVELLNFEGTCENTHTHLWWSTASEHNNDYFTIDRAGSNGVFYELAKVNGKMNTTQQSEYNFADYYAEEGVNYYRLFQTDVDGQSRELKTISVYNNCLTGSGIEVSASFNSMDNSITVGYNFDRDQMVHAALYNSLGQMVQTTDLFLDASERKAQIDLNETLSFGIYFLKLSNDEFMVSEKILISK